MIISFLLMSEYANSQLLSRRLNTRKDDSSKQMEPISNIEEINSNAAINHNLQVSLIEAQ